MAEATASAASGKVVIENIGLLLSGDIDRPILDAGHDLRGCVRHRSTLPLRCHALCLPGLRAAGLGRTAASRNANAWVQCLFTRKGLRPA